MITRLIAFLRALLTALFPPTPEQPPQPPALDALPTVYAMRTAKRTLTPAQVKAVRSVPAKRNGWVGYDNGGFDFPAKRYDAGSLFVQTIEGDWLSGLVEVFGADGKSELLVLVYPTPGHMEWSGNPPGTHPAAAVIVDAGRWARAVGE